jgi:HSP20 family protein
VETDEGALIIQGERKFEEQENQRGVQRTERRYGRFYRSIPLPDGADVEQARATFQNGVLEIAVPVPAAQNKRREIPIGAGLGDGPRASDVRTDVAA